MDSLSFDPSQESVLAGRKAELEKELKKIEKEMAPLERSLSGFDFEYQDPTPNFDRSKVKGLVATLFTIPQEHFNKANALEVCAGGKLYQVVVESEQVASQLIEKGKLRRRVTIIPLNKINAFKVQAERIATAKQLAPGSVDLALSLIGSDSEVAQAMNYVFGSTLICKDPTVAKMVTFDRRVQLRSVTLDGDTYDPSGQLSGGAKNQSSGSLLTLQSLRELTVKRDAVKTKLAVVEEEWRAYVSLKNLYHSQSQELELKQRELTLLENRMSNNPHFKIIQRVEELISQHKESLQMVEEAKLKIEAASEKIARIEKEMAELNSNRESKVESLKVLVTHFYNL